MCNNKDIQKGVVISKKSKSDKQYIDAPRFKTIYGYEDDFKNSFRTLLGQMTKEIVVQMDLMNPSRISTIKKNIK